MLDLSFTFTSKLKELLQRAEIVRGDLLILPLSPQAEIKLKWDGMVGKVYYSLALSKNPFSKREVVRILSSSLKRPSQLREVLYYKNALDYLAQNWIVAEKEVSASDIVKLNHLCSRGKLIVTDQSLVQLTEYLSSQREYPLLQAAIAQIAIVKLHPFTIGNARTSRLIGLLYLYKHGYDFKGFVSIEQHFYKELALFNHFCHEAMTRANVTDWLEYYFASLVAQIESTIAQIKFDAQKTKERIEDAVTNKRFFWEINQRQQSILILAAEPYKKITNRVIASHFNISQITASRDLGRLTLLGLLFSHGKGRSVYYTKV